MKIDDEVFVHGYVDEIRTDVVIIRNHGGYFGTVKAEILSGTQPERKKGRWIIDETDNSIECDKCGCIMWANDLMRGDAHFCPNCGARMKGAETEG